MLAKGASMVNCQSSLVTQWAEVWPAGCEAELVAGWADVKRTATVKCI